MNRPTTALAALLLAAAISPDSPAQQAPSDDAAYRAATGLLRRDMPEQAAAEYRAFLRDHPDHSKAALARYGLAVCLTRQNQWKDAAAALDALGENATFEFAPDALLLRAQCALAAGDSAGAVRCLGRLLERYPKYEKADAGATLLGETLFRAGNADEARRVLDRFAKEWPESESRPRAELFLALIDAGNGHDQQAADRLESLRTKWPEGELAVRATLTEAQCRHRMALAAGKGLDKGEAAAAVRLYRTAAESGQEQIAPDAMLGEAQLERAAGRAGPAGRVLDDLLKHWPDAPIADEARIERARAYLDEGKPDRGLAVLEQLGAHSEGDHAAEGAYWAARCELKLGLAGAAADRLTRAIEQHKGSPLMPEMLYDRAVALSRAGDANATAARRAFAEVREKYPDHPLAAEALAAEASLALAGGDDKGAAELCGRFLKAFPRHPRAGSVRLALADADMAAGHADRAEREYAAFLEEFPDDPRAGDTALRRGLALARLGRAKDAAGVLGPPLAEPGRRDPALVGAASTVLADAAIAGADWARAEKLLRAATSTPEGRTPDALLKLGLSLQRQGRADEALALFDEVGRDTGAGPAAIQASFERAQILVEQGQDAAARKAFEHVIEAEKSAGGRGRFTVHALRHLASIASRAGDAEGAAALLERVAQSPDAGAGAADALYDQAGALLAAGKYREADAAFDRFLRASPGHPRAADASAQRAIAASRLGDYTSTLDLIAAADRDASKMSPAIRAAAHYERAWALLQLGRADEAEKAYDQLLSEQLPASLEAHAALDLAQLRIAGGDYAGALPHLSRADSAATTAGGDDGQAVAERALYLRGLCELKSDRPKDAAATLGRFLERYPRSDLGAPAGLLVGQALLSAGRAEQAAARLRTVVDTNPLAETLAPALLCLGEACAAGQSWDESRAAFEQYLEQFGDAELWFQARFGIAWALENQGRQAEAVGAYRDVVSRHTGPTAARAQFQIGECLFALKSYDEAVRELLKVDILYSYPEWSAAALYEAGRCLSQLGKPDEARRQFEQVTERFKGTDWARLAAEQAKGLAPKPLPGRTAQTPEPR